MSFTFPPLELRVAQLVGVPNRQWLREDGLLTPADVQRDATLQELTRRNIRLKACVVGLTGITVVAVATAVAMMISRGDKAQESVVAGIAQSTSVVAQVAPPQVAQAVAPEALVVPALVASRPPTPTPAPAPAPAAQAQRTALSDPGRSVQIARPAEVAARLKPSVAATTPPVTTSAPHKPAIAAFTSPTSKPAPVAPPQLPVVAAQARARPGQESAAPTPLINVEPESAVTVAASVGPSAAPVPTQAALPSITIMDFLGGNTAVMLSYNGGQTVRTYRVSDALPNGEAITVIDAQSGSVSTTLRTIRKK